MTTIRTASVAAMALVLGVSLAAAGCGKYSFSALKAQKAYKEGNDRYRAQDWKGAAEKYEEALKSDPNKSEIFFYIGNAYDNQYKQSHAGEPQNDAQIQKAIEYYQKAADHDIKPEMKKLALEYLYSAYGPDKLNDPSKAEPIVRKMIEAEPNDPTSYFALAKIYEEAGRYEEAEQAYLKGRDAKPNDPTVYTTISAFYNRQGDFPKTMEALNKAASLAPDNPQGYQLVATYYWEKSSKDHRLTDAQKMEYINMGLENVNKALQLNPSYVDALVYKGLLFRQQALVEKDRAKQLQLLDDATALQKKAIELRKKTGAT
jgi:tetratricopeptide (TPR) repeat protein